MTGINRTSKNDADESREGGSEERRYYRNAQKKTAVTPNAKQKSEREWDNVKKSKRERKNNLLKYFGKGVCIPAPTNIGTPINSVLQQRESREKRNNTHDKAGEEGRGAKKQSLRK